MRISQKLVIAIYGRSCTGKSTVAKIIADRFSIPIRHCGDVTQRAAADLNVDINDLTDDCHRKIDAETVEWVCEAKNWCLVEGRYLDHVLAPVAPTLILACFEASLQARAVRWQQKAQRMSYTVAGIKQLDCKDDAFRKRMYKSSGCIRPTITIDTTCLTPEEIANCLIKIVHAAQDGRG